MWQALEKWVEFQQTDNSRVLIRADLITRIEERLGSKTHPSGTTIIYYTDIGGYDTHSVIVKECYNDVKAKAGIFEFKKENAKVVKDNV